MKKRPFSFRTGAALRTMIEHLPDPGIRWKSLDIVPNSGTTMDKKPATLYYRDPMAAIQSLLDRPSLAKHLEFSPRRVTVGNDAHKRVYSEMSTGDWWWDLQVRSSTVILTFS
jgi:Plavaka transposase